MEIDKIFPIDLFEGVSAAELVLENSFRVIRIKEGDTMDSWSLDAGTVAVVCTSGTFSCKALDQIFKIIGGQVLLMAVEDIQDIITSEDTAFEGTVIFASEELLINKQRLIYRNISVEELNEMEVYLELIESQLKRMSDVRAKIVESLVRALILSLQQSGHMADNRDRRIPPLFHDLASLISRYHQEPVYFYAEKVGLTSHELNRQCQVYSGMSAAEWINKYVLLEAKDLLAKTRLRPSQVASMLRFSNYDTFARWFRRHTGELPGNWR